MKRSQKSLRKIKLLLLLMLLTTILAITATYAWFSSQRDVEITGMKINVEVAESMQISLNGEQWLQSIEIDNMRQFYGTYSVTSTHQADDEDNLQLNANSRVWVDAVTTTTQEGNRTEGTGLENCIRVGFVVYENTTAATSNGETARGLTSTGSNAQVAIWEPNDKEHIDEVINNSGRGVQANTTMPTYGIKYSSSAVTIADVEATSGTNISEQVTMKPAYSTTAGTTSATNMTDTSNNEVKLAGNTITKVRVYIWIEDQDVDCINAASYGDRLQANIKLTKPQNDEGTENSTGLTGTLSLPSTLTDIGVGAFAYCSSLTGDLTIPEGVTTIKGGAFYCNYDSGDRTHTSVTIPASVTEIDETALNELKILGRK